MCIRYAAGSAALFLARYGFLPRPGKPASFCTDGSSLSHNQLAHAGSHPHDEAFERCFTDDPRQPDLWDTKCGAFVTAAQHGSPAVQAACYSGMQGEQIAASFDLQAATLPVERLLLMGLVVTLSQDEVEALTGLLKPGSEAASRACQIAVELVTLPAHACTTSLATCHRLCAAGARRDCRGRAASTC